MIIPALHRLLALRGESGITPACGKISYYIVQKPYSPKQVCKVMQRDPLTPLFVLKSVQVADEEFLAREMQTLAHLATIRDLCVETPTPLQQLTLGPYFLTTETFLSGRSLNHLCSAILRKGRAQMEQFVGRLFETMLELHRRLRQESNQPLQHGDLHLGNILEAQGGRWKVIDWTYYGSHYPPLFDCFSLMRSILASAAPDGRRLSGSATMESTFFDDNPLARILASNLERYCNAAGVELDQASFFFEDYLRIRVSRLQDAGYPAHHWKRFVDMQRFLRARRGDFLRALRTT